MRLMEAIVARTDLDWTVMRPLGLANMDPPTEYAVATTNKTVSIPATIWREGIKPKFVKG